MTLFKALCLLLLIMPFVALSGQSQTHSSLAKFKVAAKPKISTKDGGKTYSLTQPWFLRVKGNTFKVYNSFSSDGISAPPCIRKLLGNGVDEPVTHAAMFHDWLIIAHDKGYLGKNWTRKKVDEHFLQLLIDYGVDQPKAKRIYKVVRLYSIKTAGK